MEIPDMSAAAARRGALESYRGHYLAGHACFDLSQSKPALAQEREGAAAAPRLAPVHGFFAKPS
jgi:hypothetical protein